MNLEALQQALVTYEPLVNQYVSTHTLQTVAVGASAFAISRDTAFLAGLAITYFGSEDPVKASLVTVGLYVLPSVTKRVAGDVASWAIIGALSGLAGFAKFSFKVLTSPCCGSEEVSIEELQSENVKQAKKIDKLKSKKIALKAQIKALTEENAKLTVKLAPTPVATNVVPPSPQIKLEPTLTNS